MKGTTVIDWLHQFNPNASQQELRGLLGQMLFSGDDALKPTKALSGGESARLIFCRLMLQKPNVLVLDEPTNHLDLESINALNIALQKYDGTVLLVTHDYDVIDEVATRIWHFKDGRVEDFKGPYSEYLAHVERKSLRLSRFASGSFSLNDLPAAPFWDIRDALQPAPARVPVPLQLTPLRRPFS